jgi:hypothetical protein
VKILAWNIQFFTKRRVEDDSGTDEEAKVENFLRTLANSLYITSTVRQAAPDVFVIVEPQASQGTVGALARGGGPDGLLYVLSQLRAYTQDTDWRLVPPQLLNPKDDLGSRTYTECIGVFWNDTTMKFTGPWVWTASGARAVGTPVAYDDPWKAAVPDGTTAAGQCLFANGNGGYLQFPGNLNRRPFYTTFTERATNRTLKLYSVHTSPSTAGDAVAQMIDIQGMTAGASEITVVTGDFNVDLNKGGTAFEQLRGLSNVQSLALIKTPPKASFLATTYQATRFKPRKEAIWNAYLTKQALDYALVGYGTGARMPSTFQPTVAVVDRVAGTPSPPFDTDMEDALSVYPTIEPTQQVSALRDDTFRRRWNYGHIAQPARTVKKDDNTLDGTSDHLPILVTV